MNLRALDAKRPPRNNGEGRGEGVSRGEAPLRVQGAGRPRPREPGVRGRNPGGAAAGPASDDLGDQRGDQRRSAEVRGTMHDDDGHFRIADHGGRDGAEQEPGDARAAPRAHHDRVRVESTDLVEDAARDARVR